MREYVFNDPKTTQSSTIDNIMRQYKRSDNIATANHEKVLKSCGYSFLYPTDHQPSTSEQCSGYFETPHTNLPLHHSQQKIDCLSRQIY